ncbi:hypothetical protein QBE55_11770 [Eubacteriales bacterium mix99]
MRKQFDFIPIILQGIGQTQYLYATDILCQLYRHRAEMSIKDLMAFFRHRNMPQVWETIMTLRDLDYICPSSQEDRFQITEQGTEKIQMILACFRLDRAVR